MNIASIRWNVLSSSTLAFASLCTLLFVGIVGVIYYESVVTIEDEMMRLASRIDSSISPKSTISEAAHIVAPMMSNHALLVTLIDEHHRVTVRFETNDRPQSMPSILKRDRTDRSAEPVVSGTIGRLLAGLATIFGFHVERGRIGSLDFYVTDNAGVFTQIYERAIPYLLCACMTVIVGTILFGSWLNRQMLRPLNEVTAALNRLAAGDLTLQPVLEAERSPLNALSIAFNGAVTQVRHAFDLRDESFLLMRQFIADAGHQLRTPLTVIQGFLSIIEQNDGSPMRDKGILQSMHQQVGVMSELIENLILLDKWDRPNAPDDRVTIDIRQFIEDVVCALALAHGTRDIRFICECSGEFLVAANPYELHHALSNVLDNAIKYANGPIVVSMEGGRTDVTIVISDRGPGMSEHLATKAFDRFVRGDRRDVEGSGLGLSIAKRAIERTDGTISLASKAVSGTTVTLVLPVQKKFDDVLAELTKEKPTGNEGSIVAMLRKVSYEKAEKVANRIIDLRKDV